VWQEGNTLQCTIHCQSLSYCLQEVCPSDPRLCYYWHIIAADEGGSAFLDGQDLRAWGDLFIDLLCRMKHSGAVEKCQPGVVCLIERCAPAHSKTLPLVRLLALHLIEGVKNFWWAQRRCLQEASMQGTPKIWLQRLLQFIARPDQTLTDINRRSAGIPFAFSGLLVAKPFRGSRQLLAFGVESLMLIAEQSHAQPYPQTHAFWCLTALFQDKDLGADLHPFIAKGPHG